MGLNIKNERVHALAREAARVTGKTQTSAIEEALILLLAEYGEDPAETERQRRIQAILEHGAPWVEPAAGEDVIRSDHDLYDPETGLPR